MATSNSARILIVDDLPQPVLVDLLQKRGYDVRVPVGAGQELIQNALHEADLFRPHVTIIDLRLIEGSLSNQDGLLLINELKSARCILNSAHLTFEVTRQIFDAKNVYKWVKKGEDKPEVLMNLIDEAAKQVSASQRGMIINRPTSCNPGVVLQAIYSKELPHGLPESCVDDLLAQLFPGDKEIEIETMDRSVGTPTSASRGYSFVCRAKHGGRLQPLVVKFSLSRNIEKETENYYHYIEGNLRGNFMASLENHAIFYDLGGICYSLIGGEKNEVKPLADLYQGSFDSNEMIKPLNHFFREVWGDLYSLGRTGINNSDIVRFYMKDGIQQTLERYKELDCEFQFSNPEGKTIEKITLPNPTLFIKENPSSDSFFPITRVKSGITHGSLQADHIFSDGEHSWVIDFKDTGESPILRDFTTLELDILTRMEKLDGWFLFELMLLLTKQESPVGDVNMFNTPISLEIEPHFRVISELRKLAGELTGYVDIRQYYLELLLNALLLVSTVDEISPQFKRAWFIAALLSKRLTTYKEGQR